MKTSAAMLEIRRIRDENSECHSKMSPEERKREAEQALLWFSKELTNPLKIVDKKLAEAEAQAEYPNTK